LQYFSTGVTHRGSKALQCPAAQRRLKQNRKKVHAKAEAKLEKRRDSSTPNLTTELKHFMEGMDK
jgi:hypothetical protein